MCSPLILLYHGIPRQARHRSIDARAFEEHLRFLKRHCRFTSAANYSQANGSLRRPVVMLTFDDGLRSHAEVVAPLLQKYGIPATFFISTLHSAPGKYLWFTYLRMLKTWFQGDRLRMDGKTVTFSAHRQQTMAALEERLLALRPHPQAMYECIATLPRLEEFVPRDVMADECEGMPPELVRQLASEPLFTIGGHTTDHPYLTLCTPEEIDCQLHDNKAWIERLTGRQCKLFAYPGGILNRFVLDRCRREYERAFALEWSDVLDEHYAIHRIGICAGSRLRLGFKLWAGRWLPFKQIEPVQKLIHAIADT